MKRLDVIRARDSAPTLGRTLLAVADEAVLDRRTLLAAVDAVLELHDRVGDFQCSCGGAWPCPTVRAITEAVGS